MTNFWSCVPSQLLANSPRNERTQLDEHLAVCPSCRKVHEQYHATVQAAIPGIASELPQPESASDLRWSLDRAEAALFERIDCEDRCEDRHEDRLVRPTESSENQQYRPSDSGRRAYVPSRVQWGQLWMPYAAGVIFCAGIGPLRVSNRNAAGGGECGGRVRRASRPAEKGGNWGSCSRSSDRGKRGGRKYEQR
jgi:hypothetical protein